ncbi:MAG: choice-of-anchor O protein [Desulfobulbaceae bacterium]
MKIVHRSLMGMGMLMLWTTGAVADDGAIFRKNISDTPAYDTEYVSQRMLPLYVTPQSSDGTVLTAGVEYYNADGALVTTETMVRPLIGTYQDGPVETIEEYEAFPGHGARDAYAAVSLDDGATWKRTNLSNSAKRSSIKINGEPYPGDTLRNFAASDGNKVLFVWASKYCDSGSPNYAMTETERSAVAAHLVATGRITETEAGQCTDNDPLTPCLYLEDLFGVAGSQGVQSAEDLAEEGYPLVGDYPYSCLWAARGSLQPGLNGAPSKFVWFNAERLTSGVRSAERAETVCVKGAGCVVTWQEDPDGVRPGHGDGPGEGWSGAIAYHQTDKWYTYIAWDDFDLVSADGTYGAIQTLPDYLAATTKIGSPKAAIPMAMPVRVTDNAMCVKEKDEAGNTVESDDPYCYADFNGNGASDFCASTVDVIIETPEGPTSTVAMCVTEDGRLMRGNTASTRARLSLHGYSTLGDYKADPSTNPINSAWVSFTYEENKGLGDICDDGDCLELTDADKRDMGKNVWYHTFDMFHPEVVGQGLMLNQPSVYPTDWADPTGLLVSAPLSGYNFWAFAADPIYATQAGLTTTTLYQSEIARRPSHVSQDWYDAGPSGLVAFNLWKQGIIRRGGPADIMARRWVLPADFDPAVDNPYDYKNMVCETLDGTSAWAFRTDLLQEANPRYVKGLCAAPAINLSGNTVLTGVDCADATTCLEAFPFNEYFDDLAGGLPISEILTWQQYGPGYGVTITDPAATSLDDQSWENPYDMAKGHRGFLAGDMVMVLYAWTNNWRALTEGHDIVNLYIRRSFDGGKTWSTLPASFTHTNGVTYTGDGTTTCEFMGPTGSATEYPMCTTYAAGAFEQARDLSLLVGTNVTVLDPRYSPTTRSITATSVSTVNLPAGFLAPDCTATDGTCDNLRDPSRFFAVFETGIPSAYDEGEAEPLDLFYSRAVDWGDDYLVWQDEADDACLPTASEDGVTDLLDGSGVCNEFDALEGSQFSEASEAAITSSPGGGFMYAMWYQHDYDNQTGAEIGVDAWFRRVMYLDDYIPGSDDGGTDPEPEPPPVKPGKGRDKTAFVPPGQAKK